VTLLPTRALALQLHDLRY